jgi:rhodanese-related sulfurtransferase
MKTRLLLILTFLITCAVQASPRQSLVVDAAWLKAHLNDPDLVLLHVGDKAGYEAGHIPGARLVSLNDISVSDHSGHGLMLEMPPADDLRHRLETRGISDTPAVRIGHGMRSPRWVRSSWRNGFAIGSWSCGSSIRARRRSMMTTISLAPSELPSSRWHRSGSSQRKRSSSYPATRG